MTPILFWAATPELSGRLAITTRPRGGADLDADVDAWRVAGLHAVVSALTDREMALTGLERQADACRARGLRLLRLPIDDHGTPNSIAATAADLAPIASAIDIGECVAFHCFAGLGRSPMLAACTLLHLGLGPGEAIRRIGEARGTVIPETSAQQRWIHDYAGFIEAQR